MGERNYTLILPGKFSWQSLKKVMSAIQSMAGACVTERPRQKRTLLIVDDDEGPRKSLNLIFKKDYHVLLAASGFEALELAQRHQIDAAILDIRMIGMSGIELLEKLKATDPAIEAIMLTAYETFDTIRQALRFGACDYLSKPFDLDTIRATVANAMERRTLSEELRSHDQKMEALQSELHQQVLQKEISRNRGEIYASILHDINGPLTIISGYIQIIDQQMEDTHSIQGEEIETLKNTLKLIVRQVTHCVEISQRYLGFLRQTPSEKGSAHINKTLADLKQLLKDHPSRRRHQLQIIQVPDEAMVQINGTDLIQILLNLAINAFQSTPEPHLVKISAHILDEPVDFGRIEDGPGERVLNRENCKGMAPLLMLSVEDNGPGISPDILSRIFEPFFTTKTSQGTGLGLSIVQRLVKEAQGVLHVYSAFGEGTRFKLYLPAWKTITYS